VGAGARRRGRSRSPVSLRPGPLPTWAGARGRGAPGCRPALGRPLAIEGPVALDRRVGVGQGRSARPFGAREM
jgi:hypothetical protein